MNRLFLAALILSIAACTQQTKTTGVKNTDSTSVVKDTVKTEGTDTVQKNYSAYLNAHANDTIIPGKSIGYISIGENTNEVITVLKQPDSSDAAMGKALLSWYSKPTKKDSGVNSINIYHNQYGRNR